MLLDTHGVVSTQRLALSGCEGGLVAGLWPGELKAQAQYLYGGRRGRRMIAVARALGWMAEGAPQLAFRSSAPSQRLYLRPSIDAREYAGRWEDGDLSEVGGHSRADLERRLWPWFRDRGYADAEDDPTLHTWMDVRLGNRRALLRPGLRLRRRWDHEAVDAAGGRSGLIERIRADVNAILVAADEPSLPTGSASAS